MSSAAYERLSVAPPTREFAIELAKHASGETVVRLHGDLRLLVADRMWQALNAQRPGQGRTLYVDFSDVPSADGASIALLTTFRAELKERGRGCEFLGLNDSLRDIVKLYEGNAKLRPRVRRKAQGLLDQIGHATLAIVLEGQMVIAFFGQMVIGMLNAIRAPRTMNWKELSPTMERAGADAVPIIGLINFLVGMVIALQAAAQLKRFGADIFMADLVGISVVREIGPLMTAIIMTGRTGAAFAAELGSMKTNEEIDALRTMGFGPMRFLVMPRAIALMIVAPLLTLLADLAGVVGGLLVGVKYMGLTATAYLNETQSAIHLEDVTSGLIKSVAFALAIALISSQQGLAASGGAEGVGRRTTSAVVSTLFALIMIDAVFTLFFEASRNLQ
jgi:phospholipid/cholesterol/gamma-HCH transport system permease protein